MRRIVSTLLLALLVIGAQQAALVHEIGHGIAHRSASQLATAIVADRDDSGTTERAAYCDKCFQFAHVSGAMTGSAPVPLSVLARGQSAQCQAAAEIAADAPPCRSRGPPIVL